MSSLLVSGHVAKIQLPWCYQEPVVGTVSYVTSHQWIFTASKQKNIGSEMLCYLLMLRWTKYNFSHHMWIWYFLRAIRSSKLPLCIVQWGRNLKFLENPFKILQGRDICRFYLFGQMIAYLYKDRDVGAKPIINLIVDLSRHFNTPFGLQQQ